MRAGAPTQTDFPPVRAIPIYAMGLNVADQALLGIQVSHSRASPQGPGLWSSLHQL